jgi:NAD(P)H-hydrate epimerase
VVDGLLGTGHHGALRGGVESAAQRLQFARDRGAAIVALDVPSGLDATTGEIAQGSVRADCTLCFGSMKRGVLFQRAHAGRILVVDIGLRNPIELHDRAWIYADEGGVSQALPEIPWNAHKGSRGHLALVGGATGMAGAIVLATRAALASGCGLARAFVAAPGVAALQQATPQAIALPWPGDREHGDGSPWGDALAVGPGLGRSPESRELLERALRENAGGPVVLDADALTLAALGAEQDPASIIQEWCSASEHVVLTPHVGEFSRLMRGASTDGWSVDWNERADVLVAFAIRARATVLLKGTPTLVATPDGAPPTVVARGNAVLATGGSGDMLTGIIGALLASGIEAREAAVLGATAHGLAAEIAAESVGGIRGVTLEAVQAALPHAWRRMAQRATLQKEILSELPTLVI